MFSYGFSINYWLYLFNAGWGIRLLSLYISTFFTFRAPVGHRNSFWRITGCLTVFRPSLGLAYRTNLCVVHALHNQNRWRARRNALNAVIYYNTTTRLPGAGPMNTLTFCRISHYKHRVHCETTSGEISSSSDITGNSRYKDKMLLHVICTAPSSVGGLTGANSELWSKSTGYLDMCSSLIEA